MRIFFISEEIIGPIILILLILFITSVITRIKDFIKQKENRKNILLRTLKDLRYIIAFLFIGSAFLVLISDFEISSIVVAAILFAIGLLILPRRKKILGKPFNQDYANENSRKIYSGDKLKDIYGDMYIQPDQIEVEYNNKEWVANKGMVDEPQVNEPSFIENNINFDNLEANNGTYRYSKNTTLPNNPVNEAKNNSRKKRYYCTNCGKEHLLNAPEPGKTKTIICDACWGKFTIR